MPMHYSQEINLKNSISAFNKCWGQQMRNDKATAPIIQGTETMDEYSSFVACFLYTVLIFVFL